MKTVESIDLGNRLTRMKMDERETGGKREWQWKGEKER